MRFLFLDNLPSTATIAIGDCKVMMGTSFTYLYENVNTYDVPIVGISASFTSNGTPVVLNAPFTVQLASRGIFAGRDWRFPSPRQRMPVGVNVLE